MVFAGLDIRTIEVDITPNALLPLGGYTVRQSRPMNEGGQRLWARIIRFRLGDVDLAVVSVEMLTIPESLVREVRARIDGNVGVMLLATHTHSAPDSQMLNDRMTFSLPGIAKFDAAWLKWYAERIAAGIQAVKFKPSLNVSAFEVQAVVTSLNRSRRRLAVPDRLAKLVSDFATGRPIFSWFSAHAVFHGEQWNSTSGDWPGAWASSSGAPVFVGAIGDVSPVAEGDDSSARIRNFVAELKRLFDAAVPLQARKPIPAFPLSVWREPVQLSNVVPHPEFARTYGVPNALASALVARFSPEKGEVTVARIGKLCLVGIPGEPTSALGRRIRDAGRNLGFEHVLVLSHCNGWIGYILEAEDYDRGGYEASLAFHGPTAAQRVFEASIRAMRKATGRSVESPASAKLRRV